MIPKNYTEAHIAETNGIICSIQDDLAKVMEYLDAKNAPALADSIANCIADLGQVSFTMTHYYQLVEAGNRYTAELLKEVEVLKNLCK